MSALCMIEPPFLPTKGAKGSRARGYSYEKKVGRFFSIIADSLGWTLHSHPWLAGPCQPDYVLESPSGCLIIIEVKLTQTDCSAQIARYRHILGNVPAVQVCRRLTSPSTIKRFDEIEQDSTFLLWL